MNQENSSHTVYRKIRKRILAGSLLPGTRLVNRALGKELGVSPIPVREALHRLVSDGIAEQIPGAGTFVRTLSKEDLIQLSAVRELLEGFAASEAATHARPDQIMELKLICKEGLLVARQIREEYGQTATGEQRQTWLDIELRFHRTVIALAGNPWLSRMVERIQLLSGIIYAKPRTITLQEVCRTCRDHARLVRIIGNGDAEKAQHRMTLHIKQGVASQLLNMNQDTL